MNVEKEIRELKARVDQHETTLRGVRDRCSALY